MQAVKIKTGGLQRGSVISYPSLHSKDLCYSSTLFSALTPFEDMGTFEA